MKKLITISGILFCILIGTAYAQTQIGETLIGSSAGDFFSINDLNSSGSIMIVGAPHLNNDGGYARVYEFDGSDWVQMGTDLLGENTGDRFGWQVAMNGIGNIVAVYAPFNDGNGTNSGHARVYQYDGNDWVQLGGDIEGVAPGDTGQAGFGDIDLSNDGTILAISATYNDDGGTDAGHIRVFEFDGNDWVQQGNALEGRSFSFTGYRLSLNNDGSRVTKCSAFGDNANGLETGIVGIYEYDGTNWVQVGTDINGTEEFENFGADAVLNADGSIVAISAPGNDGIDGDNRGRLRVFQFDGTDWIQLGQDIDGDQDGAFGFPLAINEDGTVISYSLQEYDISGANRGIVRIYKYNGNEWVQSGIDIEGLTGGAAEGWSTNLSQDGTVLATGALFHAANRGSARVFDLSAILSIEAISNELAVSIYPNPASNTINILGNTTDLQLHIYDMVGRKVISQKATNQLDVSFLQSGNYLIHLTDGIKTTTSKLIKN